MEQKEDESTDSTIRIERPVYHRPIPDDPSAIIVDTEEHESTIDVKFDVLHTRGTFVRTFSLDEMSILPHVTTLQDATKNRGDGKYGLQYAEVTVTSTGQEWRIDGVEFNETNKWLTADRLAASGVIVSAVLTIALIAAYTLSGSIFAVVFAALPVAAAWIITVRAWFTARKNGEV